MGFCSNFAAKFETFNNSKNTIMTKKIFIIGLVLAAVLSMSGCMPGSEKWNIHIAAHCYIKVSMWRLSTLSARRMAISTNASFIC